jgi:hypothetical protein
VIGGVRRGERKWPDWHQAVLRTAYVIGGTVDVGAMHLTAYAFAFATRGAGFLAIDKLTIASGHDSSELLTQPYMSHQPQNTTASTKSWTTRPHQGSQHLCKKPL